MNTGIGDEDVRATALQLPTLSTRLAGTVLAALLLLSTVFALSSFLFYLAALRAPLPGGLASVFAFVDINSETSVSTWFSSKLLFVAALLLWFLSLNVRRARLPGGRKWFGLALIFLYLSVDEATSLHERIGGLFAGRFALTGVFFYAWVVPFSLLLVLFLAFYAPFFLRLPGRTRGLIALAGALYLGGALGAEVAGALIEQDAGRVTLAFVSTMNFEEWLEMAGASLFIFALLDYAARFLRPAAASSRPVRVRERSRGDLAT